MADADPASPLASLSGPHPRRRGRARLSLISLHCSPRGHTPDPHAWAINTTAGCKHWDTGEQPQGLTQKQANGGHASNPHCQAVFMAFTGMGGALAACPSPTSHTATFCINTHWTKPLSNPYSTKITEKQNEYCWHLILDYFPPCGDRFWDRTSEYGK